MDLSQRALEINGKFLTNFELLAENRKILKQIDQIVMCYLSMDLARQDLQTYECFFQISESFIKLITIFLK